MPSPSFKKRSLSLYLRTGCERQFILYLYTDKERELHDMPSRQQRSGLGLIGKAGYTWQFEKVSELKTIFSEARVHENPASDENGPKPIPLSTILPSVQPYQFIVEGTYEADTPTFRNAVGLTILQDYYGDAVKIGETRPDIIQILPSMQQGGAPTTELDPNPYELGVAPNGNLYSLDTSDDRFRLRVIDVKLTSEPGANYFAEVVYYSMTLAGWLIEKGLDKQFVVTAAPAIWPGKHDASNLAKQMNEWQRHAYNYTDQELINVLDSDLEIAIFDVFAPRLRNLLTQELPQLLSKPWNELSWHVDFRCKGCEFLSRDLSSNPPDARAEKRCYPTAENSQELSRVYGLSKGAGHQLRIHSVKNTPDLANTDSVSDIFDTHQGLKTKRTAFPHRAQALMNGTTSIIPASGGDALMPKWPDLRIFAFLEYDLSSAITASMAIRANWREPLPFGSSLQAQTKQWTARRGEDEVFLVDMRTLEREREEFLKFLRQLVKILDEVRNLDDTDHSNGRRDRKSRHSKYQIYIWDESQKKHLVRLISRHLPHILADNSLRNLAWLFPPPEILQHASEATRKSALTFVKTVVENTVALDVPHYYGLLDLASRVVPNGLPAPFVHDLYKESFSDLIPMERLHEYWTRKGQWLISQDRIVKATQAKVYALGIVADWLQRQLQGVLSNEAAPPITPVAQSVGRIAPTSRLWLGFTELNAAIDSLETHTTRAMPPHERVARFRSAHLILRLEGQNKLAALELLNQADGIQLPNTPSLFIYEMHPNSTDVNLERGDFLYALSPRPDHGFLDRNAYSVTVGTFYERGWYAQSTIEKAKLTAVNVQAVDRDNRLIALEVENAPLILDWEQRGQFNFSSDVMLDPIHEDYLTKKVHLTLRGIGHPPSAVSNPQLMQALGLSRVTPGNATETPASEILWNANRVQQQTQNINIDAARGQLEQYLAQDNSSLNQSQWVAWNSALRNRLALIWGPPGTGKSRTLRAIILGIVLDAKANSKPIRILVSANTYTAIDNVLLDLENELARLVEISTYYLCRIQSTRRDPPPSEWSEKYPTLHNLILDRRNPSTEINNLLQSLDNPDSIVIVGCPPQQLHNLAIGNLSDDSLATARTTIKDWFDYIIVDEASQVDVATGTLLFSKRAVDGACIIAGDDKQLPPIHQADPPEDLEHMVGSLYNFFRYQHEIQPTSLDVNYRSNQTIVEFTKLAGYSQNLESYSPHLQLNFSDQFGDLTPVNWPSSLLWTPDWKLFLDPSYPAVSFVYKDILSTQVNDFEADTTAALIWLLHNRLQDQLLNERNRDGTFKRTSNTAYSSHDFWQHAVGVVTPHRAQRSRVIGRLKEIFPQDSTGDIVGAVDTVERYQGQERDIIIASFGIGDPDLIRSEDEFLYNLNRFNVLASRARAKLIVLCTESLLQHLSDDVEVLKESRLLKGFAEAFCQEPQSIQIGDKAGILRRRGF
jgi:DNA replication ATP-dependent helicase Dna2